MTKEKQKMTLNVRRRANAAILAVKDAPPAADSAQLRAFADTIETSTLSAAASEPTVQVVRDAFSMPAADHHLFAEIQRKCLAEGIVVSKSEIVRAGLKLVAALNAVDLTALVAAVPKIKTGRPTNKTV